MPGQEQNQLKDAAAQTPIEPTPAPIDDNDSLLPAADAANAGGDAPAPAAKSDEPPAVKGPPSDDARAKIAQRFSKKRSNETSEFDNDLTKPENLYGKTIAQPAEPAPAKDADGGAAPAPAREEAAPEAMALTVYGKQVSKSIDEIAVLLDMTPEEVRAHPEQAKKLAQKNLAADQRLEESKRIHRQAVEKMTGEPEPGARPDPASADQRRAAPGNQAGDQPPAASEDLVANAEQLIEQLQLEDPKTAAPKLVALVKDLANQSAKSAVSESKGDEGLIADRRTVASGVKQFSDEHPELVENRFIQAAMAPALVEEYKEDLTKALIAEGHDESEARQMVESAAPEQIQKAHQVRRVKGDPNVRQIDKGMLTSAYDRVRKSMGLATPQQPQPRQDFAQQRQERKAALPHQPQRASVPPAMPTPPKAPMTRSSAVADMKKLRGQK